MDINEIVAIALPFVSYLVTGIVMLVKVIKAISDAAKKQEEKQQETSSEVSELKEQIKIANQENAELRKEVKKLTNAVYHIKEE